MKTGKCKECNGTGEIEVTGVDYNYTCPVCKGDGKFDWIEAIVGKKHSLVQGALNRYFNKIDLK